MLPRDTPTTAQLPKSARAYYVASVSDPLRTYTLLGKDDLGRKVYAHSLLDGPIRIRALLTVVEYKAEVKRVAAFSASCGVSRWTSPFTHDLREWSLPS